MVNFFKFSCLSILLFAVSYSAKAQWTNGTGTVYTGNQVLIGSAATTSAARLVVNYNATGGGTAWFTSSVAANSSIFNYGTGEHTYINGGKSASILYLNTKTGLGSIQAGNGTNTFNMAGSMTVSNNLGVTGNINMGGSSLIQSPTNLQLASGASKLIITPTASNFTTALVTFSGNVKIGSTATTPAGYRLFVEQGILTEKVKIALKGTANWADHVFNKDYELMPLDKVERYIKTNGHLPNVPSAEEMVKEGNDLGKTDAMLLEKIEELTLHLIEMKQIIDQQQQKIEGLTKKIK